MDIPVRSETIVGIAIGSLNGIFTGMTGAFSFPGVLYLQALGLNKDQLVQAMGMLFAGSSLALGLSLASIGFLDFATAGVFAVGDGAGIDRTGCGRARPPQFV